MAADFRVKSAAASAAEKIEDVSIIAAVSMSVAALEKGVAGGFLQTGAAQVLRQFVQNKEDMLDGVRRLAKRK